MDQVTQEMSEWGQRLARDEGPRATALATDDDVLKMSEITETMSRCMTQAMTEQDGDASTAARDPGQRRNVAPTALDGRRIAGNKNILPDPEDRRAITRSGKTKLVASYKLSLDIDGNIDTISRLKSSTFPGYDAKIEREMHDWRYRPFLVDGVPAAVCTAVTFIYAQEAPATPKAP